MGYNQLQEIMEIGNDVRRAVEQLSYALFGSLLGDRDAIDVLDTMKDRGIVVVPDDIKSRMSKCFGRLRELHTNIVNTGHKLHTIELSDKDRLDALGVGKADGATDLGMFVESVCIAVVNVLEQIAGLMEIMVEYRAQLDAVGLSMLVTYFTPSLFVREAIGADGNVLISGTNDGVKAVAQHTIEALRLALGVEEN